MSTEPAQPAPDMKELIANSMLFRRDVLAGLIDSNRNRDIDKECGYPERITADDCKALYDREGIASRVVAVEPAETWKKDPEILEGETSKDTAFEKAWKDIVKRRNAIAQLHKVDRLSGIGTFGILLLGVDDGKTLDQPVDGLEVDPMTGLLKKTSRQHKLLYLRAFDETAVQVSEFNNDVTNPRFGQPDIYTINFAMVQRSNQQAAPSDQTSKKVHWSRVIHVADNRESSEVFGEPRMQNVWNRLFDLRKVLAASGEMFWKGGFPGISFEVDPEIQSTQDFDRESLRKEMEKYSAGLQRYLALVGVSAKSLQVQVADPTAHFEVALKAIAVSKGIPWRILLGSEEAKLASDQDATAWNERVQGRQSKYVTPMLVRPFVDRLIALGVLPEPKAGQEAYNVVWPALSDPSPKDKAEVAAKLTECLAKYTGGGVETLVPPMEYFVHFLGVTQEVAKALVAAMEKHLAEIDAGEGLDDGDGSDPEGGNEDQVDPNDPEAAKPGEKQPPGATAKPGQAPKGRQPAKGAAKAE